MVGYVQKEEEEEEQVFNMFRATIMEGFATDEVSLASIN